MSVEQRDACIAEYRAAVGEQIAASLPPILDAGPGLVNTLVRVGGNPDSRAPGALDLVAIRRAHETKFAKRGLRTSGRDVSKEVQDQAKAHTALVKMAIETLKLQQDHGVGTGLERKARWTTNGKTGNAANAAAVAATRSAEVCDGFVCFLLIH